MLGVTAATTYQRDHVTPLSSPYGSSSPCSLRAHRRIGVWRSGRNGNSTAHHLRTRVVSTVHPGRRSSDCPDGGRGYRYSSRCSSTRAWSHTANLGGHPVSRKVTDASSTRASFLRRSRCVLDGVSYSSSNQQQVSG